MSQDSADEFRRRIAKLESENERLRQNLESVKAERKELYGPATIEKPATEEELIEVMKNQVPGSGQRLLAELGITLQIAE
jgi:hypothetical protein